mmetsp:Transcript_16900/g.42235  ORF Transcript_16900/g.42235 Transcript_16900/m.42235 type:complete len:314 (-) Transcript_16900:467-1408(-)|eukprot:CAMPEP_0116083888 /NCGR_PEP_ID=MMETSP0327-20121206/3513_1 /TAXON_ID=44447 /ORGANISM="Pseudo-nitzschia delicatissima, Strain B596" /LENGTH=313 /DNA_ID=CAMNT_0003574805 /DNA_START=74 /DNA_END=1015 /DNA_ORIENTATION=+
METSGIRFRQRRPQLCRMPRRLLFVALPAVLAIASLLGQQHCCFILVASLSILRNSKSSTQSRTWTKLGAADIDPSNGVTPKDQGNNWIESAIEGATTTVTTTANDVSSLSNDIQTRFFLVNTKHPGNVGSSARSIKTMGFFPEGLVVVDPHDKRVLGRKKCIDASSGAKDVLEQTLLTVDASDGDNNDGDETSSSRCLEQALKEAFGEDEDILVCGTGMPVDMGHSRAIRRYLEPRTFFESLLGEYRKQRDASLKIAFVFGNERYGMAPEDLDLCDVVLGIPTHPSFGSLNLATAVQIVAYDWRLALGGYDK